MENQEALSDLRFLRDVVEKTQPGNVNHYWPVSIMWGCVIMVGYLACVILGMRGDTTILPWVWPALISLVASPLNWYMVRKIRSDIEGAGVRPGFRKDLVLCWASLTVVGALWTAGLVMTGAIEGRWYVLMFVWGSLYVIGYVMNGILLSREWFWAAGVMLASLIAVFAAGPNYYWMPGLWIGGTSVLAGLLGRRNARLRA